MLSYDLFSLCSLLGGRATKYHLSLHVCYILTSTFHHHYRHRHIIIIRLKRHLNLSTCYILLQLLKWPCPLGCHLLSFLCCYSLGQQFCLALMLLDNILLKSFLPRNSVNVLFYTLNTFITSFLLFFDSSSCLYSDTSNFSSSSHSTFSFLVYNLKFSKFPVHAPQVKTI